MISKKGIILVILVIFNNFRLIQSNQAKEYSSYKEKRLAIKNLEKKLNPPKNVNKSIYKDYVIYFGPEWSNFVISEEKVKSAFLKYFENTPYRVIWNWDIDGDGNKEYLGVEECPGVRRGIKKGILVDEKGKEKLYIDTERGVYSTRPLDILLDLKKIGHRKNEVYCYAIGYRKKINRIMGSGIGLNKRQLKQLLKKNRDVYIGKFGLQRLSKNFEVMGCGVYNNETVSYCINSFIITTYLAKPEKVIFEMFIGAQSLKEVYQWEKRDLIKFRKSKKPGKTFKPPQELNPKDIEIANEIYEIMDTEIRK